ncbi:MAG: ABC transporter substrate-binding protein [Bdellovibrionota bacterium]|nr:MAG: ABC transporter substrate-binding protein [Bdellovibrionota bacterium]
MTPSAFKVFWIACLFGFASASATAEELKPEVRIGAIIPLTGDMAVHGVEIQNAMQLAIRHIDPQSNYSYTLFFEDNQLDGAKSATAARKLIDFDKVDVVLTLWPPTASIVIPISERANILHYTISWDPSLARRSKYVLSHQAMVDEIARSTLRLLKSEKKQRVAFFHMEETGFNLGAQYLRVIAPEEGIELISDEAFNPSDSDFRALITRSALKSPDAYLVWAVMPAIDTLVRQVREQNRSAFISGYFDYLQDLRLVEGAPYVSEMYASDGFMRQYREAYGKEPVSKGANAYDIVNLLVTAYERSPQQKPSASELKSVLTTIRKFPGAVGEFSIGSDGNSSYSPAIRRVEGSSRKFVGLVGQQ